MVAIPRETIASLVVGTSKPHSPSRRNTRMAVLVLYEPTSCHMLSTLDRLQLSRYDNTLVIPPKKFTPVSIIRFLLLLLDQQAA